MRYLYATIAVMLFGALFAEPSGAVVLCQRRSGVVALRDACRATEVQLDSATVATALECPPDAAQVGPACVDKYEASVWQIPAANTDLIDKVKAGDATLGELMAGGATQIEPLDTCFSGTGYAAAGFGFNGNWSMPLYAASVAGIVPSGCINWFQSEQACRLSGKRLLTNQEWQAAAAGTPDPGGTDDQSTTCATVSPTHAQTGARTACVSKWGVHDMIGNAPEWVGDWGDRADGCSNWDVSFGSDRACVGGAGAFGFRPGGMVRGGDRNSGLDAGVFTVHSENELTDSSGIGFRCGR